ncbi:MAG: type II toxin-antitoxin system VapC family toxin [Planctomycetaceae bacterium]
MIFIDTWAWIALADRSDPYHRKAKAEHKRLRRARRRYVTTDYVLGEIISYLYAAIGTAQAQGFISTILESADTGHYVLVHVSPNQFRRAWELRQKYRDKPQISFVDLTSMVVMQDLGVDLVFTGDAHFQQVGLGFQLLPSSSLSLAAGGAAERE